MEPVYSTLSTRAREIHDKLSLYPKAKPRRAVIAFAGPPGSGKSTIAEEVVRLLNEGAGNKQIAAVVPMDGFHLTRATLDAMPNREEAIARRGAAWTFDAQGVVELVTTLRDSREDLSKVHEVPGFDHALKDPIQRAIKITPNIRILILEGNWLLMDAQPWSTISKLVDDTWFVDVDPKLALTRVAKRHLASGIEKDWAGALLRAQRNDIANGDLIRAKLIKPKIYVQSVEELILPAS
jgi:pantothenate kinase